MALRLTIEDLVRATLPQGAGHMGFIGRFGRGAKHNGSACLFSQVHMPGNKVGVKMGFQHILDPGSVLFRPVNIGL